MKKMLKKSNVYMLTLLFLFCFGVIVLLSVLLINNQGAISSTPVVHQVFSEKQVSIPDHAQVHEEFVQTLEPVLKSFEESEINVESSKEIINESLGASKVVTSLAPVTKSNPVPVGSPSAKDGFVYVNGTEFNINGMPFYFSGANNYYLRYAAQNCVAYDENQGCQKEILDDAQDIPLRVLRTWGFTDGSYYWGSMQPLMGDYDEGNFQKMDYLVKEASERNIKLILPFVNNWNEYGGMCQYVRWCGVANYTLCNPSAEQGTLGAQVHDTFYTDSCTRDNFKNYIAYILNRTNIYTGVKYKDDTTIFAWELANEPRAKSDATGQIMNDWIDEMSSFIKSIDTNHMVTTGAEGFYLGKGSGSMYDGSEGTDFISNHNYTNIDYASFHLYPDYWSISYADSVQWIEEHADDAHQVLGKPVVLGEFNKMGTSRDNYLQGWYETIKNKSINGNLIWELVDENYPWDPDFGMDFPNSTSFGVIQGSAIYSIFKSYSLSPLNSYPQLEPISGFTVTEGDLVTIVVNATDVDGDYLYYSISDAYKFNKDGNVFTWQTRAGDTGTYFFDMQVSDGVKQSFESFVITVLENANCTVPYDGMIVSGYVDLCPGSYFVNQSIIVDSNSVLDCEGAELYGDNSNYAVQISGSNSKVTNCVFKKFKRGIQLIAASDITIDNNYFGYYMYHGINMQNSEYIDIINNTFVINSDIGVYCYHSSNNLVDGNNFTQNGKGIYFDGCTDNIIKSNTLFRSAGGGILLRSGSARNEILGNEFTLNAIAWRQNAAISIAVSSNNNEIKRNNITDNFKGIEVYESDAIDINNNNIYSNDYIGLLSRGTNIDATNNWWGTQSCYLINSSIKNYSTVPKPEWRPILDAEYPYGNPINCVEVECTADLDCGADGFFADDYCSNDNVVATYVSYTCSNPGTVQSICSHTETQQLKEVCSDDCYEGSCETIECSSDSDCGTSGWLDLAYCSEDNVWDVFGNYSCINPGTPSSSCITDLISQEKETCYGLCQDGECDNDEDNDGFDLPDDCNDTNSGINPGAGEICDGIDQNCDGNVDEESCPDLSIYHYSLYDPKNPVAGDDIVFKIEIKNTGYSEAENIEWLLDTNSSEQDEQSGGFSLDVMESMWIYPELSYNSSGNYSLTFILDYQNNVREDDETNNEIVIPISVGR